MAPMAGRRPAEQARLWPTSWPAAGPKSTWKASPPTAMPERCPAAARENAMDQTDLKILSLLQKDATRPVADIAEQVNLSVTPCWRRIQKMKEDGVIERTAVLLDPKALGLNLTVFVSIKTSQHNAKWTQNLIGAVMSLPNVEFHRMAGDIDYLLKVVVEDMAAYDRFYRRLIEAVDLLDVSASFSMEVIKSTTELPLDGQG